jgi:hypothetical protein
MSWNGKNKDVLEGSLSAEMVFYYAGLEGWSGSSLLSEFRQTNILPLPWMVGDLRSKFLVISGGEVNSMDLNVSTPDRIFWNLREYMETGNSPCAWFCNPCVEDSGICVRRLYKQQRWNFRGLSLVSTTAVEPSVQISVRKYCLVLVFVLAGEP